MTDTLMKDLVKKKNAEIQTLRDALFPFVALNLYDERGLALCHQSDELVTAIKTAKSILGNVFKGNRFINTGQQGYTIGMNNDI